MMGTEHPDYRAKFESIVMPRKPAIASLLSGGSP